MVIHYQLLILAVASSVVSSVADDLFETETCVRVKDVVTTKTYSQPFPLDMPVSQACKERAQAKCNGTCGWAECVAIDTSENVAMCYLLIKKVCGQKDDADDADCCPKAHVFTCCQMPANRKYTWVKKNMNEMILVVDEKQPDCKNKQPRHTDSVEGNWSYYCACEFSSYHRMMDGMCCSGDDKCGCCWTDPIISKLPRTTTFSMYHGMRYGAKQNQGLKCTLLEPPERGLTPCIKDPTMR
uniref:WAP domain-containing protein n=1 Tax=Globodera pallida TaxID=36090 RepID=A0A183CMD3_GLOPA